MANLSRFHLEFSGLRADGSGLRAEAAAPTATAAAAVGSDAISAADAADAVPASAFTCFNLGGVDYHGRRFDRTADYTIAAGAVGSLWVGVDLPASLMAGTYRGTLSLTARSDTRSDTRSGGIGSGSGIEGGGGGGGGGGGTYTVALSLVLEVGGAPIAEHGDGDIYSLSRLRWLDSTAGIDDTLPAPFVPPRVLTATPGRGGGGGRTRAGGKGGKGGKGGEGGEGSAGGAGGAGGAGFEVELLNKRVAIGEDGLLAQIEVDAPHAAVAAATTSATAAAPYTLLTRPMALLVRSAGALLALRVVQPAVIVAQNRSGVHWKATLQATLPLPPHATILVQLSGGLEYDSFCEFSIEVSSAGGAPVSVDDIQLELPLARQHARYMVGMGVEGVATRPLAWRWEMGTGNNGVWLGRAEAGTFLKLRGEGGKWEDPMFSSDNGVTPLTLPLPLTLTLTLTPTPTLALTLIRGRASSSRATHSSCTPLWSSSYWSHSTVPTQPSRSRPPPPPVPARVSARTRTRRLGRACNRWRLRCPAAYR